jgi:predicted MPP superfamily phosphohydrolase
MRSIKEYLAPDSLRSKKGRIRLLVFSLSILMISCFLFWQNQDVTLTRCEVISDKLPAGFDGMVILQVSDLHNAYFGEDQSRLIELSKEASPDLIFLTGDLIDYNHPDVEAVMQYVLEAVKLAPVFFVEGNHELGSNMSPELIGRMTEAGVTVLQDQSIILESKGDLLALSGISPNASLSQTSRQTIQTAERIGYYEILLAHRPELFEEYEKYGADLIFSGHAHGGQIRIPYVCGIYAPGQGFFPEYSGGVYKKGEASMILSRGLGNSIFPFRVFNRPELVAVTLTAAQPQESYG